MTIRTLLRAIVFAAAFSCVVGIVCAQERPVPGDSARIDVLAPPALIAFHSSSSADSSDAMAAALCPPNLFGIPFR